MADELTDDSHAPYFHFLNRSLLRIDDQAESCYPFVWQRPQRELLRSLLQRPQQAPTGTDELALARYAQYAAMQADEKIFREGLRREPHNALYHYLLAEWYLTHSLRGRGPQTVKKTGTFHYDYTITDRHALDQGMRELALGMQLPFQSHRAALIHAQLAALPPTRDYADRINEFAVLSAVRFPEYGKVRNFARVNGFYLSLLLQEGKRAEAEPFLHTGEHLVVQLANDSPLSLIDQLVTLAVGDICEKNDARVCRSFGLTREAAMIEAHQALLIGKLHEWKLRGRLLHAREMDTLLRTHAGILPGILLPVFGTQPAGLITQESLRPSRLVEYVLFEGGMAGGLSVLACLLLLYAGLHYWRWKLVTRGAGLPAPNVALTPAEWLRLVSYGLLAPLALYLLYIALPAVSWRDHGIARAGLPFGLGVGVFTLWTLIVPTTMAAGLLRQRSIAAGLLTVAGRPWRTRFARLAASILAVIWCLLVSARLLPPISVALLAPVLAHSPFGDGAQIALMCFWAVLIPALPLLPALWTRKHADAAPHHLAMARSMMTLYAVMTLFFAALVPVSAAFERHYVRIDRIMAPMQAGDDIGFTMVEGQLTLMLRQDVRDGATALGIPWR
jgi:hypothetical protein